MTIALRNDRRAGERERHVARHQSIRNLEDRAAAERDVEQTVVDRHCRPQQSQGFFDRWGRADDLRPLPIEQPGQGFRHQMLILDEQDVAPGQIGILHGPPPLRAIRGSW